MQFESATKGNVTMQIWLGKQYLGQRDNLDQHINTDVKIRAGLSKLDDAEPDEYMRMAKRYTRRRSMSHLRGCLLRPSSKSARAIRLGSARANSCRLRPPRLAASSRNLAFSGLHPPGHRAMLSSMRRAIGYARVSTDKQADHGVSLSKPEGEDQRDGYRAGAEFTKLIVDGGSRPRT
jgi:hypothetical protein